MKKMNYFVILISALTVFIFLWLFFFMPITLGEKVEIITPDEQVVWPLHNNANFKFNFNGEQVEIKIINGTAFFLTSSCPGQTCVKSGFISKPGQVVICAPNRVVLRIKPRNQGLSDALITY